MHFVLPSVPHYIVKRMGGGGGSARARARARARERERERERERAREREREQLSKLLFKLLLLVYKNNMMLYTLYLIKLIRCTARQHFFASFAAMTLNTLSKCSDYGSLSILKVLYVVSVSFTRFHENEAWCSLNGFSRNMS